MRIGLATAPVPVSLEHALRNILEFMAQAAPFDVELICFPEAYLPGMRGKGFSIPLCEQSELRAALKKVCEAAAEHNMGVILPMEWPSEHGRYNLVQVISPEGKILGRQCKIQLDPEVEGLYIPGRGRQLFEVNGVKFGVVICHEGWRYPETVRWAACRGAQIVFHPQCTGSNSTAAAERTKHGWGDPDGPYYEKAMVCRSVENGIFFASVNYALSCQDAATSLVAPDGSCLAHQPYGVPGLLVQQLELELATGQTAKRYQPDRY
jgi:predicted amidohydrolase